MLACLTILTSLKMGFRYGDVILLKSHDNGGYISGGGFVSNQLWVDEKSAASKSQHGDGNIHDACFRILPRHNCSAKKVLR